MKKKRLSLAARARQRTRARERRRTRTLEREARQRAEEHTWRQRWLSQLNERQSGYDAPWVYGTGDAALQQDRGVEIAGIQVNLIDLDVPRAASDIVASSITGPGESTARVWLVDSDVLVQAHSSRRSKPWPWSETLRRLVTPPKKKRRVSLFQLRRAVGNAGRPRTESTMKGATVVLGFVEGMIPKRIAKEELGDAEEYMRAPGRTRLQIYLKLVSTVFFVGLNALREVLSSLRGKSAA